MRGDQKIVRPDGFSGGFQRGPYPAIRGISRDIECQHLDAAKNGVDARKQLRRPLPGWIKFEAGRRCRSPWPLQEPSCSGSKSGPKQSATPPRRTVIGLVSLRIRVPENTNRNCVFKGNLA